MSSDPKRMVSRAQWLRRLASRKHDKTAFVLSGGGPYGALQVGALKALAENGVFPDLVVGTSVGSLNATFLAFDPTPHGVARLESIWRGLEDDDLFPGARFRTSWARFLMRGNRVFDNSGIRRLVQTRLGTARFEDARVPLAVMATDLETGAETLFTTGDIIEPLLASTAMPGIFPPVAIGARTYIDGGVSNQVPIGPALEMGARRIFVLNCSASSQRPRPLSRPIDYLLHAFALSRSKRLELELPAFSQRADVRVIPTPTLGFTVPFTSMVHTAELLELGYECTKRYLEAPVVEPQGRVQPLA